MENKKDIIDVCCGGKAFWFNKQNPRVIFCDKRDLGDITLCNNQTITIKPDVVCDFQNLPFENESFNLAVFDPPHLIDKSDTAWLVKKYGTLPKEWQPVLQKGFAECMRVLKPNGVLIFKWNEVEVKTNEIIDILGFQDKLLFGHKSGKRSNTNWLVYMK